MSDEKVLVEIDGPTLAAAFPVNYRPAPMIAGLEVAGLLAPRQRTERFAVQVEQETVLIPTRLYFASHRLALTETEDSWRFARALQTRSSDGFERQRAARDLLVGPPPWAAPFILALVGGYVVEILQDILAAMTPEVEQTLGAFIVENEAFWKTIERRVISYWNVYYRGTYRLDEYVGTKIVERLGMAAVRPSVGR